MGEAHELEGLRDWIGRSESRSDRISASALAALSATLDRDDAFPKEGEEAPPLAHWLHFLPLARTRDLATDGHPAKGGFLPPVPLPRRMWAGGRVQFHAPLRIGDLATRISTIEDVAPKQGRSGALVFVKVRHEIRTRRGLALTEHNDLVYRGEARGEAPPAKPARTDAQWSREIRPGEPLLFRYSALTFNAHRIHYDRRYATEVEGYPGLVVHGPLIATLLVDLARRERPGAAFSEFSYRAVAPLFEGAAFRVCGREEGGTLALWAMDANGALATEAALVKTERQS